MYILAGDSTNGFIDLGEEVYSEAGVWYTVYVKTLGDTIHIWRQEAEDAIPWDAATRTTPPILVGEAVAGLITASTQQLITFNTNLWATEGAMQIRDLTTATWYCAADVPELQSLDSLLVVTPTQVDFGEVTVVGSP